MIFTSSPSGSDSAEVKKFEDRWPIGTFERTAFALHKYLGQRRGDVNAMLWPGTGMLSVATYYDYDGNEIVPEADEGDVFSLTQEKTGAHVDVPMHPKLAEVLAAWPPGAHGSSTAPLARA